MGFRNVKLLSVKGKKGLIWTQLSFKGRNVNKEGESFGLQKPWKLFGSHYLVCVLFLVVFCHALISAFLPVFLDPGRGDAQLFRHPTPRKSGLISNRNWFSPYGVETIRLDLFDCFFKLYSKKIRDCGREDCHKY